MAGNKVKSKNMRKKSGKKNNATSFLFSGILLAAIILPTSFLLFVGMLPTLVCVFISRGKRTLVVTVGAMNLAACSPFLLTLWTGQHNFESSVEIIANLWSVVLMFSGAAIGYVLDWSTRGIVKTMMLKNAVSRQKQIKKRQKDLVARWGKKVTGRIPLDQFGRVLEGAVLVDEEEDKA